MPKGQCNLGDVTPGEVFASATRFFASATFLDRHFSDTIPYNGRLRTRQLLRIAIWEADVLEVAQEIGRQLGTLEGDEGIAYGARLKLSCPSFRRWNSQRGIGVGEPMLCEDVGYVVKGHL